MDRKKRSNRLIRRDLALLIHEILDEPLNAKGDPALGYKIVNAILATITKAAKSGEDVYIKGFGIFRVVEKPARKTGNNIVLSDPIVFSPVPITHRPRKYLSFRPASQLMAMLNKENPNWLQRRAITSW